MRLESAPKLDTNKQAPEAAAIAATGLSPLHCDTNPWGKSWRDFRWEQVVQRVVWGGLQKVVFLGGSGGGGVGVRFLGVVVLDGLRVGCGSGGCMATSVGVGPFGALATSPAATSSSSAARSLRNSSCHALSLPPCASSPRLRSATFRVRADAGGQGAEDGVSTSTVAKAAEKSEVDRLMEGISFGQLCDEFECISSPAVERTARQLVKDIMDIKEGQRSLSNFGVDVEYKDPIRSFKGRDKYKRANWIRTALEKPTVAVREMRMLSTSILNIKWTVRGKPKLPPASALGGKLVWAVNSTFIMNQISGQVTRHEDEWDLSGSDPAAQAYFWTTRLAFSAVEGGKDMAQGAADGAQGLTKQLDKGAENNSIYPDPSGDPRKFFQSEDNPQKDLYQVGLVIAMLYLLVQFLKLTL